MFLLRGASKAALSCVVSSTRDGEMRPVATLRARQKGSMDRLQGSSSRALMVEMRRSLEPEQTKPMR